MEKYKVSEYESKEVGDKMILLAEMNSVKETKVSNFVLIFYRSIL